MLGQAGSPCSYSPGIYEPEARSAKLCLFLVGGGGGGDQLLRTGTVYDVDAE